MNGFRTGNHRGLAAACSIAASAAVVILLWLLRSHYFNATNAGWGDQEQDRHQWLLGWGVRISFTAAVTCLCAAAAFSKRVRIAIPVGIALSLSTVLIGSWLPTGGFILGFPGVVAALYAFGVHNGGGFDVATFSGVINAVVYSGIAYLLLARPCSDFKIPPTD